VVDNTPPVIVDELKAEIGGAQKTAAVSLRGSAMRLAASTGLILFDGGADWVS